MHHPVPKHTSWNIPYTIFHLHDTKLPTIAYISDLTICSCTHTIHISRSTRPGPTTMLSLTSQLHQQPVALICQRLHASYFIGHINTSCDPASPS
mmetsp:Transcript_119417/g.207898  ORF Transcript_119417/g.207898 Transcript_119417/m.207898 type:complete len:95 (-) Transcript_119417:96-380(-)